MNIKAIFPPGASTLIVNGLHQWDYGRKLEIQADDLPALVEVHFACEGMQEAVVRSCAVINGVAEAAIPDICLEQTTPVKAWVYEVGESSGSTTKTISLPIIARARPQVSATDPSIFSDKYTELITAVNEQVESLKEGDVTVANALQAGKAARDAYGRDIPSTYVTSENFQAFEQALSNGDLPVAKAGQADEAIRDELGRKIVGTYMTNAGFQDFEQALSNGDYEVASARSASVADKANGANHLGEKIWSGDYIIPHSAYDSFETIALSVTPAILRESVLIFEVVVTKKGGESGVRYFTQPVGLYLPNDTNQEYTAYVCVLNDWLGCVGFNLRLYGYASELGFNSFSSRSGDSGTSSFLDEYDLRLLSVYMAQNQYTA